MLPKWLYCDIDNTLTAEDKRDAAPVPERIARLKRLIDAGVKVVLWSMSGQDYATRFAQRHGINAVACLRKPSMIVDDRAPLFRPANRLKIVLPEEMPDAI